MWVKVASVFYMQSYTYLWCPTVDELEIFSSAPVGLSADYSPGPPLLLKQELVSLTLLVLLSVDLSCVVSVGRLLILEVVAFFALLDVL